MTKFFTRTDPVNPVQATMELLDLHIGCVMRPNDGTRFVAIMLQPSDALLNEHTVGTTLANWEEVEAVIQGLISEATLAWGANRR